MRARVVGLAVIGLGGLAVAASVTARSWVPLTPVDLRLDESSEFSATGEQVSYLDPVTLAPVSSDDVSVTVTIRGDEDAGDADDDTAVWEYVSETDDANGTLVATSTTVVCLDRRTAEAQDCSVGSVDGEATDLRGLTVRFPADTQRRVYDLWDTTARKAFPARFAGAESLDGLQVYRFEQEVPAQVIRSIPVPGALVGSAEGQVAADVVYATTRTLLVEPVSGVIVSDEQLPQTALRGPGGATGAVLLSGSFSRSGDAVGDAVATARDVAGERAELQTAVQWTTAATGAALLALGALLLTRRRPARPDPAQPDATQDDAVRVPVPSA